MCLSQVYCLLQSNLVLREGHLMHLIFQLHSWCLVLWTIVSTLPLLLSFQFVVHCKHLEASSLKFPPYPPPPPPLFIPGCSIACPWTCHGELASFTWTLALYACQGHSSLIRGVKLPFVRCQIMI